MKQRNKKNTFLIVLFLIIFVIMTIYYIVLSKTIADYKPLSGDRLRFYSLGISFKYLLNNPKQQNP